MLSPDYAHEAAIDVCNETLLTQLHKYANQEQPLQLSRLINCYAWDVMGATTVRPPDEQCYYRKQS